MREMKLIDLLLERAAEWDEENTERWYRMRDEYPSVDELQKNPKFHAMTLKHG